MFDPHLAAIHTDSGDPVRRVDSGQRQFGGKLSAPFVMGA